MRTKILSGLLLFSLYLNAQVTDTTWLDNKWKKTSLENAKYYRLTKFDNSKKLFIVKDHYLNGDLQMSGQYISLSPEKKDGIFKYYFPKKTIEARYKEDAMYRIIEWDETGKIVRDEGGDYIKTAKYVDGSPVYSIKSIDKAPKFDRGNSTYDEYISNNFVYPEEAWRNKVEGTVIVKFIIDKKGDVQHVGIFKTDSYLLNSEALRLVYNMPKWLPGILDGERVNLNVHLPISFKFKK